MPGVPDDKRLPVVVDPPLVGLDKDVRLVPHGRRQVEERAAQSDLAVARRRPQAELFVAVLAVHRHQTVGRLAKKKAYD